MVVRRLNGETVPTWHDTSSRAVVSHGFRSSFRVWAGEMPIYPREVVEAALAHTMRDKTEVAYARTNLLERRRPVMEEWGQWWQKLQTGTAPTQRAADCPYRPTQT